MYKGLLVMWFVIVFKFFYCVLFWMGVECVFVVVIVLVVGIILLIGFVYVK